MRAFIQLQPGETPASVPPQALIEFTRSKLAAFKTPRFISYVDSFPLTPSERIAKHQLLASQKEAPLPMYDAVTQSWR